MRLISTTEIVEHLAHLAHLEHLEHLEHLDVVIDGSKSVVTSRRSSEHLEKGRFDEQRHQDVQDVKMLNFLPARACLSRAAVMRARLICGYARDPASRRF
jgi:demethoxyubiquinone hydroxylase (CLK1/Coq7/Cat5 family)